jgi:hypothetical protein
VATDPPLSPCPTWCEKESGHDWEDMWRDGLIRNHTMRRVVSKYHQIGIDEIEQVTTEGVTVRQREVVLDVESPTQWDRKTAMCGYVVLTEVMAMANVDWPEGEVR